jgi:hypothetical protein
MYEPDPFLGQSLGSQGNNWHKGILPTRVADKHNIKYLFLPIFMKDHGSNSLLSTCLDTQTHQRILAHIINNACFALLCLNSFIICYLTLNFSSVFLLLVRPCQTLIKGWLHRIGHPCSKEKGFGALATQKEMILPHEMNFAMTL